MPEALWTAEGAVVELPPPSDEDVARVLHRTLTQAKKDWAGLDAAWPEDEYEELQQRAIQERLHLAEPAPKPPRRRVAVEGGVSVEQGTHEELVAKNGRYAALLRQGEMAGVPA